MSEAENYTLGANRPFNRHLDTRRIESDGAFFLPHLRPGLSVIDCGCAAGSITIGIARIVAPAQVVGVDADAHKIEAARLAAQAADVPATVRFETASVYHLPFANASFDRAFANLLFFHLSDVAAAFGEMRRVVKPGGIVGIRDIDAGASLRFPSTPLLERMRDLEQRVYRLNGGNPTYARSLRSLLMQAGFRDAVAEADTRSAGTRDATERSAAYWVARFRGPVAEAAISEGWVDSATVEQMCEEALAWGQRSDSFYCLTYICATAVVPR